jgi:hypothetical protein
MQMPYETADSKTLLLYGIYHLAQLKANSKTKHLAPDFELAQNKLRLRSDSTQAFLEAVEPVKAVLDRTDEEIDLSVKNYEQDLLKGVEYNREHPLFKTYFPEGLRHITAADLETEVSRVEKLLAVLNEEKHGHLKKEHHDLIESKLNDLKKAMKAVKAADDAYGEAFSLERAARLEWRRAYKKNEAELAAIFVGDKKKVDSFFKKAPVKKKAAKKGGDGDGADAGGEGGK